MKKEFVFGTGMVTYALLLLLAGVFYKERTVILDSSYHLFHIVHHKSLAIQGNRFGAALTQIYPLLAVKMNLSLNVIAVVYSLSFPFFFLLAFLFCLLGLKNTRVALAIMLFNVLMVTHTFYWPHPELPAGVVFTLLCFAWTDRVVQHKAKPGFLFATAPLWIVTIVFFHPLLIFVFFFLNAYFLLVYKKSVNRSMVVFMILSSAGYLLVLVLKAVLLRSSYENGAMGGLKNIFLLFPHYFNLTSNKDLVQYCLKDYYFLPVLWTWLMVFYIRRQEGLRMVLFLLFFCGLCFIINLNYVQGADQFYLEAQYLILSLFLIFPLVYELLPAMKSPERSMAVVLLILGIGIYRMERTHSFYSERVNWYRTFLKNTAGFPERKLILPAACAPVDTLLMTWGSSYEFWLLSTMEQGVSRSVIIEEQKGEFDWLMGHNKALITKWELFEYKNMDRRYYIFNDTGFYRHYTKN